MTQIRVFIFIALLSLLNTATLYAADGVYIVDMQRVLSESIAGKAAKNNLEAQAKKKQAALSGQKADLDKLKTDLEKQDKLLSESARNEKRADFAKKVRDFEQLVAQQREELGKQNSSEIQKIVDQTKKVVNDLAKEQGHDLVLENDGRVVLYVNPKYDLTTEVIKILDSKKVGM